jgi:hypothetical protein
MSDPTPTWEYHARASIGADAIYQPDPRPELAILRHLADDAVKWLNLPSASGRAEAWLRVHDIAERIGRVWGWHSHAKIGIAVTGLSTPENQAWHGSVIDALNDLAEAAHNLKVYGHRQSGGAAENLPALPAENVARFREAAAAFSRAVMDWPTAPVGAKARVGPLGLVLDDESRTVFLGVKRAEFGAADILWKLLMELCGRHPNHYRAKDLWHAVWNRGSPKDKGFVFSSSTLQNNITRLRHYLEPLGIQVGSDRIIGYVLEKSDPGNTSNKGKSRKRRF